MPSLLPLVLLTLTACAPKGAHLVGTWTESGEHTTIDIRSREAAVTGVIDDDGEVFLVLHSEYTPCKPIGCDQLKWTYLVPSTKYEVKHWTTFISEDRLEYTWENQYDTGDGVLNRVE